jgi:DNA-binding transcriptional MocR family regulator
MVRQSFLIISKDLLANKSISVAAKLLFAQLCDHRNKRTGRCNPRQGTLALELGISEDTVQRGLCELRDLGFIEMKRERYGCQYEIKIPQNAVSHTAKCGISKPQNAVSDPPYPLNESYLNEPYLKEQAARSRAASLPKKKSMQSEVLERYYAQQRRKARQ